MGARWSMADADSGTLDAIGETVLERLCDRNLRIATCESCTGGLIASLLTDIEGKSHAFERGFVVYTNEAKAEMLGVDRDLIEAAGAVSGAVAEAMVRGALERSAADVAVSVTGYAGPAPEGGESGLVHVAAAVDGAVRMRELHLGDIGRTEIREASARAALLLLLEMLR